MSTFQRNAFPMGTTQTIGGVFNKPPPRSSVYSEFVSTVDANGRVSWKNSNDSIVAKKVKDVDVKVAKHDKDIVTVTNTGNNLSSAKADKSALNALESTVNTKADKSALNTLETTVDTKADLTALETLETTVNTKADLTALNTLETTVDTKADLTALETLETTVDTKADLTALETLETTVNTKADLTALEDYLKTEDVDTNTTIENLRAEIELLKKHSLVPSNKSTSSWKSLEYSDEEGTITNDSYRVITDNDETHLIVDLNLHLDEDDLTETRFSLGNINLWKTVLGETYENTVCEIRMPSRGSAKDGEEIRIWDDLSLLGTESVNIVFDVTTPLKIPAGFDSNTGVMNDMDNHEDITLNMSGYTAKFIYKVTVEANPDLDEVEDGYWIMRM